MQGNRPQLAPPSVRWHTGYGAGKGPIRLLAWVNDCPLVVHLSGAEGEFRYEVLGHSEGVALDPKAACRRAFEAALGSDRSRSECRYLEGAGGPFGFFCDHGASDPAACVQEMVARRKVQGYDADLRAGSVVLELPRWLETAR